MFIDLNIRSGGKLDILDHELRRVDLNEANLRRANLHKANLRRANLHKANLCEANLYKANLRWANLSKADLYGADLRWANLYRANLRGANLNWANLYKTNLYKTNLQEANLSKANLSHANFQEADLRGANLYRADLRGANLYRANLYRAKNLPYEYQLIVLVHGIVDFDGIINNNSLNLKKKKSMTDDYITCSTCPVSLICYARLLKQALRCPKCRIYQVMLRGTKTIKDSIGRRWIRHVPLRIRCISRRLRKEQYDKWYLQFYNRFKQDKQTAFILVSDSGPPQN